MRFIAVRSCWIILHEKQNRNEKGLKSFFTSRQRNEWKAATKSEYQLKNNEYYVFLNLELHKISHVVK